MYIRPGATLSIAAGVDHNTSDVAERDGGGIVAGVDATSIFVDLRVVVSVNVDAAEVGGVGKTADAAKQVEEVHYAVVSRPA